MTSRVLAAGTALWCTGYLVLYLAVVAGQQGPPVWWYVALVVTAALVWAVAAVRPSAPGWMPVGVVAVALALLVGLLSLGLLLVPALLAGVAARLLRSPPAPRRGQLGDPVHAAAGPDRR